MVGAVDPPYAAVPHADGNEGARNLHKIQCAWLQTIDTTSGQRPDSVPACLDLGKATPDVLESQEVVVLVNHILPVSTAHTPFGPTVSAGIAPNGSAICSKLPAEKLKRKTLGPHCAPQISPPPTFISQRIPDHLIEVLPAKVVTEDLGTRVESPYFVGVATIVVARTHLDDIKSTRNW